MAAAAAAISPSHLAAISQPLTAANGGADGTGGGGGRTRALLDLTNLGGLHRLNFSAAELSRCGLGTARARTERQDAPPGTVSNLGVSQPAPSAASLFPSPSGGLPAGGFNEADSGGEDDDDDDDDGGGGDDGDSLTPLSPLGASPPDAKVFVLSVQRMRRRRRERSHSLRLTSGAAPTRSAHAAPSAMDESGVDDPLHIQPFERWATSRAPTPPGAPRKEPMWAMPAPPKGKKTKSKSKDKR